MVEYKQRRIDTPRHRCLLLMRILAGCIPVFFVSSSFAHGDLHEQIQAINESLRKKGPSITLFLKRADLHRLHNEWSAALQDIQSAEKLGAVDGDLYKARIYIDVHKSKKARDLLNTHLIRHPSQAEGYYLRSRTWLAEKNYLRCVEDLDQTLALSENPSPDLYFERALLLKKEGGDANLKRARAGLEEGLEKIGSLIAFQELLIQISLDLKDYDKALKKLEVVLSNAPRKERWLGIKSEILSQAGKHQEALKAKEGALQAIVHLPPVQRNSKAILKLEADLETKKFLN